MAEELTHMEASAALDQSTKPSVIAAEGLNSDDSSALGPAAISAGGLGYVMEDESDGSAAATKCGAARIAGVNSPLIHQLGVTSPGPVGSALEAVPRGSWAGSNAVLQKTGSKSGSHLQALEGWSPPSTPNSHGVATVADRRASPRWLLRRASTGSSRFEVISDSGGHVPQTHAGETFLTMCRWGTFGGADLEPASLTSVDRALVYQQQISSAEKTFGPQHSYIEYWPKSTCTGCYSNQHACYFSYRVSQQESPRNCRT